MPSRICTQRHLPVAIAFAVSAGLMSIASPARAATITMNFDSRSHGQIIDTEYQHSKSGATFTASNFRDGPDLAVIFNTTRTSTNDHDLEDQWDMGNIAPDTVMKNIIILAENDTDANGDGLIDRPDDQGSEPTQGASGEIAIRFDTLLGSFQADVIDVEPNADVTDDIRLGYFAFKLAGSEVARVNFTEFVDPTSAFYDPTLVFGDNSANRLPAINVQQLQIRAFDEVVIGMGLCYGFDNLEFETVSLVPEPSSLLALVGLPLLMVRRSKPQN